MFTDAVPAEHIYWGCSQRRKKMAVEKSIEEAGH